MRGILPKLLHRRGLDFLRDQREGGQDVGELAFGESVEVGDHAVQFGAELGTADFVPEEGVRRSSPCLPYTKDVFQMMLNTIFH